ncbi:MAG: agmatinase [Defluviitaleaceae bacterium]|nr:agmatinase [Defluviitaleaceae bacterium]
MLSKPDVFIGSECSYEDAKIVMFSAPFDGTTTFRPGTRFAGKAIRADSFGIESYSPYQDMNLYDMPFIDIGDLELPFGDTNRVLDLIEGQVSQILENDKKPFMVGGEHLVTLGAIRAMVKAYPDLHILHLDAHADLRDDFLDEKYSHATVMRRIWDIIGDSKIYQAGIRSGDQDEFEFAKSHTVMHRYNLEEMDKHIAALKGKPVYFSLDLDVLDPSVFPGTGTPEPGGVTFQELHQAVLMLKNLNIVGCDVCELSPHYDSSGISTAAACKIIREILMVV